MAQYLKILTVLAVAISIMGCATADKKSNSAVSPVSQKQEVSSDNEAMQKRIDERVDDIAKERKSKWRLNSLFGRK